MPATRAITGWRESSRGLARTRKRRPPASSAWTEKKDPSNRRAAATGAKPDRLRRLRRDRDRDRPPGAVSRGRGAPRAYYRSPSFLTYAWRFEHHVAEIARQGILEGRHDRAALTRQHRVARPRRRVTQRPGRHALD